VLIVHLTPPAPLAPSAAGHTVQVMLEEEFGTKKPGEKPQPHTGLSSAQLQGLLTELNRCVAIPYVPPEHFRYLIATIDDDMSGVISWREFYDFLDTLQFSYMRVRKESAVQRRLKNADWARTFMHRLNSFAQLPAGEGWGLERFMMGVMVLNAISVTVEISEDYYDLEDGDVWCCSARTWGWIDSAFALVYVVNISIQLTVIPFDKYWSRVANRLDFFATYVLPTLYVCACVCWFRP
jgi:hypothetical protein